MAWPEVRQRPRHVVGLGLRSVRISNRLWTSLTSPRHPGGRAGASEMSGVAIQILAPQWRD